MDLLLANAYLLASDAEEQRIMRPHPPLGVLYLSSHLKARGFSVGVFDGTFQTLAAFDDVLQRQRPRVTGIAVNMMTKRNALEMIAIARRHGTRVVVGGPDPPHHAAAYLEAGAHVVVIGEGERTLEELIPRLDTSGDLSTGSYSGRRAAQLCRPRRARFSPTWTRNHFRTDRRLICPRTCAPGGSGTASEPCR
jgi:anaerobic magnesium-protoporphyrin IX monomethyl ester cyclase